MTLLTVQIYRLVWLQGSLRVPMILVTSTTARFGISLFKSDKVVAKFLRKDCKEYRMQSSIEKVPKFTHRVQPETYFRPMLAHS